MTAARVGKLDAIKLLLDRGAVLDAKDREFQQTALMVAVRANHPDVVQLMVERRADVNAATRTGETPPWVLPNSVPGFGHGIGIVRGGLPERGSRYLIPGGLTPLLYAARDGRLESARMLVAAGANVNQTDPNGITPLLMAITNNHMDVARFLIDHGAEINVSDWYGRTPLWAAVETRNMDVDNAEPFENGVDRGPVLELIQLLLDRGADPNTRMKEAPPIRRQMLRVTGTLAWVDFTGQTPFLTASLSGDLSVMRLLLEYGADPYVPTFGGTTALMAAAGINWVVDQTYDEGPKNLLEAVKLCAELGMDVNAVNSMGLTAVHGAANRGSDDIIRYLVAKGARLDVKDKEGRTPLTWAAGVFLATHPANAKAELDGLDQRLDGERVSRRAMNTGSLRLLPMAVTWTAVLAMASSDAQTAAQAPPPALLNQYCITCHNQRLKSGGLALDSKNFERVADEAETWEKVVRKIRTGMMPPSGARRPERAVLDRFASDLEARLDQAVPAGAGLDAPSMHRLNRTEYANAIRDLLALDVDVTTLLPSDASSDGFDNIADALSVSPSLIQGYVSAAMKISRRAVGDRTLTPTQITYAAPGGLAQDRHIEGLPLGTRGGMLVRHTFPLDAEYELSVTGGVGFGGGGGGAAVDVTLDGEKIATTTPRSFRIPVTAGPHTIGAALVDRVRSAGVDEAFSDFRINSVFTPAGGIQTVVVTGPFKATSPGDTPSRHRIFVCQPTSTSAKNVDSEGGCARKIITTLARRAYRRPPVDAEVETLMSFYQQGRTDGDFETGVQQAIARILVSPAFLYRVEGAPRAVKPGTPYRLSDLDLASRLSFFLWSSIPDDQLLDVAAKGRLRDATVLGQQVKRMLADPRSEALTENFAGQWLYLRDLANVQTSAKAFDDNLRQAFRRETEMLFSTIVRDDRSVVDLLNADYTFVDERLARHYGIPDIHGSYFRRVPLDAASPRRGLLGQGSMLTVTSVSTRTSPVSRGKWILETLLGTPAPVPPPGIDTNLEKNPEEVKVTSLRQRLEAHRGNPVCASCHKIMDPIGFALENFDLVGEWRDRDGRTPIDASGQLVDGTKLQGPADLRQALLSRSDAFVTTATEKLLTYALGRPVQYYDMPAVRTIVRRAARDDYRFSALVLGVVESAAFQMKMKKP